MSKSIASGKLLIIGHGRSANLLALRVRELNKECKITIVGKDIYHHYDVRKLNLVAKGQREVEDLVIYKQDFYDKQRITVRTNQRVSYIDRNKGQAVLSTGEGIPFDKLVIANGCAVKRTGAVGSALEGVFNLHEAKEAVDMFRYTSSHKINNMVIIGGGLLGIELALDYQNSNRRVFLVHRDANLMNKLLDAEGSALVHRKLANANIAVLLNDYPVQYNGTGKVESVVLQRGQKLPADMVIECVGVKPLPSLFNDSRFTNSYGIKVNNKMQTLDLDIYAIGNAVDCSGSSGGGWDIAETTADIAARNIVGENVTISAKSYLKPTKIVLPGLDIISIAKDSSQLLKSIARNDISNGIWWRIYLDNDKPVGGLFVNSSQIGNLLEKAIADDIDMATFINKVKKSGGI